jgi:hypothetical protein
MLTDVDFILSVNLSEMNYGYDLFVMVLGGRWKAGVPALP